MTTAGPPRRTNPDAPFDWGFSAQQAIFSLGTLAVILHAVFSDVVIHPFFFTVHSIVPLLVPGGILGAFIFFRRARKGAPTSDDFTGVIALLVLPVVMAPFFWIVFAKTPAWTAALLFGEAHSEVREFEIRDARGSKGCSGHAVVVDDLRLFPANLCVGGDFAAQYDRQRVHLRLSGQRTPLGFRITRFEHQSAYP